MSEDCENVKDDSSAKSKIGSPSEDCSGKEPADDDGIENFLSDAIGPDVDGDVFKDIGDSDAFAAELLEVVTASFNPSSAANSRRNSLQEPESDHDSKVTLEISNEKTILSSKTVNTGSKKYLEKAQKITIENKIQKSTEQRVAENEKIKSRLKVRLKFPTNQRSESKRSMKTVKANTAKQRSPPKKTTPEISAQVSQKKRRTNIVLHKKCTTKRSKITGCEGCCVIVYDILKTDKFFQMVTPSTKQKSSSTSINLCLVSEDKIEEFHAIESKNRVYYQKLFNPNKPTLNKQNENERLPVDIAEISKVKGIDPKCQHQAQNIENIKMPEFDCQIKTKTSGFEGNETPTSNEKNVAIDLEINKDYKEIPIKSDKLETDKALDIGVIQMQEFDKASGKVKAEEHIKEKSCSEFIKDESAENHSKNIKRNDTELKTKKYEQTATVQKRTLIEHENSSTSLEEKCKIKKRFGDIPLEKTCNQSRDDYDRFTKRQREKDGTKREKDKKFERFENERQRKSSDTKKTSRKTHNRDMTSKILQTCFSPSKGLSISQSFRIPKAQGDNSKKSQLPEPTPLSKLDDNDFQSKSQSKFYPGNTDEEKEDNHQFGSKTKHTRVGADHQHLQKIDPDCKPKEEGIEQYQAQQDNSTHKQSDNLLLPSDELQDHRQEDPMVKVSEPHSVQVAEDGADGDDCSLPVEDGSLPPLSDLLPIGNFAKAVTELIQKKSDIADPTFTIFANTCDPITEKCAWWFAKCDKEPPCLEDTKLRRLESVHSSDAGSDSSFIGNISDSDTRDDDCQVHEISSSTSHRVDRGSTVARDPDKVDEFCGRSLLQAKIRTSSGQNFRNLFDLRSGALYEKENFQAKCNLCNQLIIGKQNLATHVRGIIHKENLRKLDLHMDKTENNTDPAVKRSSVSMTNEENKVSETKLKSAKKDSKEKEIRIKRERDDRPKIKTEPSGLKMEYATTSNGLSVKIPIDDDIIRLRRSKSPSNSHSRRKKSKSRSPVRRRRNSRSRSPVRIPRSPTALRKLRRSRSPGHHRRHARRSRSRSPRAAGRNRRSDSDEYRNRRKSPTRRGRRTRTKSKSPPLPKKDNREFHAKLALTADGKWTEEMEKQWKLMEAEEAMFREQFIDRRKEYVAAPEEHPKYATEWTEFWERRYQEIEKEGKDPDTYNYVIEWKDYWSKRLNFLLQDEADEKIREIKRKYKMDFESLNLLRNNVHQSTINETTNPGRVYFERDKAPITVGTNSSKRNGSIVDISSGASVTSGSIILQVQEQTKVPDRKSSISVEDFKSTWDALTRPKSDDTKRASQPQDSVFIPEFSITTPFSQPTGIHAPSTSSSDGSFDFLGFDLVQVLRLMCKTEDHLSFLAPKVLEYYKTAEELELKKSKGSHVLLCNEELVTVLFQARDRFMTMIRSNVLGREVLQTLNLTVFGLNAILEAPQCQRFRPKVSAFPEPFVTASSETPLKPGTQGELFKEPQSLPVPKKNIENGVSCLVAHLSSGAKSFIADKIAKYLLLIGGQGMSNPELTEFVLKLISPLPKKPKDQDSKDTTNSSKMEKKPEAGMNFDINHSQNTGSTVIGHDYTHSFDMRITGVSGSKTVGSALPTLPHMSYNRSGGPATHRHPNARANNNNNSTDENERLSHSQQTQSRADGDGRQSPFSRRELPMNPIAERDRVRY